jgi:hypothetical protein
VQGIKRFGKNPAKIRFFFLPTKDEKAILSRIKTRSSNRAGQNNIKVKLWLSRWAWWGTDRCVRVAYRDASDGEEKRRELSICSSRLGLINMDHCQL